MIYFNANHYSAWHACDMCTYMYVHYIHAYIAAFSLSSNGSDPFMMVSKWAIKLFPRAKITVEEIRAPIIFSRGLFASYRQRDRDRETVTILFRRHTCNRDNYFLKIHTDPCDYKRKCFQYNLLREVKKEVVGFFRCIVKFFFKLNCTHYCVME